MDAPPRWSSRSRCWITPRLLWRERGWPGPRDGRLTYAGAVYLSLIAIVVKEYDPAIDFFVGTLGFELVENFPSLTNDGRPKRWVVVRPPGAATGLLLAQADGPTQTAAVGQQFA